jgi:hypothetical protein
MIPVIIAMMKPIAPSQSKSPASVPRLAERSGSMLPAESGGSDRRFRPSRQPTLGLASELSGYPDKAKRDIAKRIDKNF